MHHIPSPGLVQNNLRTLPISSRAHSKQPTNKIPIHKTSRTLPLLEFLLPIRLVAVEKVLVGEEIRLEGLDALGAHDQLVAEDHDEVEGDA